MKLKENVDLKVLEELGFVIGTFARGLKFACYLVEREQKTIAEIYVLPSRDIVLDTVIARMTIYKELDILKDLIEKGLVE